MTFFGLSLRAARAGLTSLIVVALLAGLGLAVHRTTTTTRTTRPVASSAPVPATSAAPAAPSTQPLTASGSGPVVAGTTTSPANGDASPAGSAAASPPALTSAPEEVAAIGKCPVKLATPKEMGGVQSLVAFAPAFGPFSAEAFAAAAAYQPELELLGPILAQYPAFAPLLKPLLAPVLALFATGSNSLFAVIEPLYKPHRTQVLGAETKLAAALAPYSAKLAGTPLAGCVVDLEAAMVGDTSKTRSKQK